MSIDVDKGFKKAERRKRPLNQMTRGKMEAAEKRLSEMKKSLVSSDLLCKVICLNLGVREDSGSRLFRNKTGLTMKEWREAHRKKPASNPQ